MYIATFLCILLIHIEHIPAIRYPILVHLINLDKPIGRSGNKTQLAVPHWKPRAPEQPKKLYDMRNNKKTPRNNMTNFYNKHTFRMNTVIDHMRNYHMSSLYLYSEMQRIKRTGIVRDRARIMLKYMDELGHNSKGQVIRQHFIYCYKLVRPADQVQMWSEVDNNNFVIHYLKDPPNDGVN